MAGSRCSPTGRTQKLFRSIYILQHTWVGNRQQLQFAPIRIKHTSGSRISAQRGQLFSPNRRKTDWMTALPSILGCGQRGTLLHSVRDLTNAGMVDPRHIGKRDNPSWDRLLTVAPPRDVLFGNIQNLGKLALIAGDLNECVERLRCFHDHKLVIFRKKSTLNHHSA